MTLKKACFTALMTCLLIICSFITVPFAVPFTLQTFAVFAALLFLGGKRGLISVALYIAMGALGLPVFSGFRGGIGHLAGPTGGYIFGFLLTALIYLIFEKKVKSLKMKALLLLVGLFLCYGAGTAWFVFFGGSGRDVWSVIALCVLPYIIPDLIKMALAIFIYKRVSPHIHL